MHGPKKQIIHGRLGSLWERQSINAYLPWSPRIPRDTLLVTSSHLQGSLISAHYNSHEELWPRQTSRCSSVRLLKYGFVILIAVAFM